MAATDVSTLTIKVDTSQAARNVTTLDQSLQGLFKNLLQTKNGVEGLLGSVLRLGTELYLTQRAITTVTGFIAGMVKPMLDAASAMEKMNMAYSVLAETPQAGAGLLGYIKNLSSSLPLTIDAMDRATRTLLGFGFTAQEVKNVMVQLADVTQGNSENFAHLALVYGQVRAQGKAMQQDIYQFVNAGIPIMEALADVMELPVASLRELIREGEIGLPQFEAALKALTGEGGRFYNFTALAADTLEGRMTIAASGLKKLFGEMGEALLTSTSGIVKIIGDIANAAATGANLTKVLEGKGSGSDIVEAQQYLLGKQSKYQETLAYDPGNIFANVGLADVNRLLPMVEAAANKQMNKDDELAFQRVMSGGKGGKADFEAALRYASRRWRAGGNTAQEYEYLGGAISYITRMLINPPLNEFNAPGKMGLHHPEGRNYIPPAINTEEDKKAADELAKLIDMWSRVDWTGNFESVIPRGMQDRFGFAGTGGLNFAAKGNLTKRGPSGLLDLLIAEEAAQGYGPGGKTRAQIFTQMMGDTPAYGVGRGPEYNPMAMPYPETWWPAPTGEEAYTMPYVVGGGIPRGVSRAMGTELESGRPGARGATTAQEIENIRQLLALEKERDGVWKTLGEAMAKGFESTTVSSFLDAMTQLGRGTLNAEEAISAYLSTLAANMAPLFMEAGLKLIGFGATHGDYASIAGGVALLAAGGFSAWASGALEANTSAGVKYNYGSVAQASNPYTGALLSDSSRGVTVNMQIIDQSSKGVTVSTETTTNSAGQKQVRTIIRDALRTEIASGSMDTALRSRGLAASGAKARS